MNTENGLKKVFQVFGIGEGTLGSLAQAVDLYIGVGGITWAEDVILDNIMLFATSPADWRDIQRMAPRNSELQEIAENQIALMEGELVAA